jgi:hypothetical protein
MDDRENILPLYDRAKNKVYDSFIQVQRQAVASEEKKQSKTKRRLKRIEFTKRYNKFYYNVIAIPEYKRLKKPLRELFEYYHKYGAKLFYQYKHIDRATTICAITVERLNLTRITNLNQKRAF